MEQMRARLEKGRERYFALWEKLTGRKLFLFYIMHYTLLFMVVSYVVFADFRQAGKTFMWIPDGPVLYFPSAVYVSQTVRNGIQAFLAQGEWQIPLYDFTLGPTKLELALDPIQLISILCPWDRVDVLYDVLVVVRFYLVGASFSVFGFFFLQKPVPILIGAISYTFCGFMLYAGIRDNVAFAPAAMYLPLLIVGIEKAIRDARPIFLILIVSLAMITYTYMAYMLAIVAILYIIVRIPKFYKPGNFRTVFSLIGELALGAGIGAAISGFRTIPTLNRIFDTGRIGHGSSVYTNFLHYENDYYETFLSNFIVTSDQFFADTYLGFSVLALPAIILLFANRKKKEKILRILFLLLTALMLLPVAAYIFSALDSIKNRWCFAYAFCVAAILMFKLSNLVALDKKTQALTAIGIITYITICYFVIDHRYYHEEAIVLLIIATLVLVLIPKIGGKTKCCGYLLCLIITCISVCYSAFLLYDTDRGGFVSQFRDKGVVYDLYGQSQYASFAQSDPAKEDTTFYRVAGDAIGQREKQQDLNMAFYSGINGLSGYTSFAYPSYVEWITELELARRDSRHRFFGLRSRSPMLTLANVKYYVLRESGKQIAPYGFREIERIKNNGKIDSILVNEYALPIGYTYETYITRDEYDALSALEKQEAQLQAVVLLSAPHSSDILNMPITNSAQRVPITIAEIKDLDWRDGVVNVIKDKATITLKFEGVPETETYLRVIGLDLTDGASTRRWSLTVDTGKTATDARFSAEGYMYDHGMKTQLLGLGYTEDGYNTCTITFPSKGTFRLEGFEIWCQPMDSYGEYVNALREEALENIETNWRGFTGTISVSKDKMLCIAVPYDKGWTAYVDGEKVKLYQANTAFMAVELPAGEHVVELKYWTPGLTVGIILSATGILSLAALVIYRRKKSSNAR